MAAANYKYDAEWRVHYEGILDNILKNTVYKPEMHYSAPKRAWYICNFFACSVVCCAPCCAYDTACCISERVCGAACCPYGMYCLLGKTIVDDIYKEKNKIAPHTTLDVSPETVRDVCKKYIIEFDLCVAKRTARDACTANSIREMLVSILQRYLRQWNLTDDGDICKLRKIVYDYKV